MPDALPSVTDLFNGSKSSDLCLFLLQDLSPRERTLLILRHGLGLDAREMSSVLGDDPCVIDSALESIEHRVCRLAGTMLRNQEPVLCDS